MKIQGTHKSSGRENTGWGFILIALNFILHVNKCKWTLHLSVDFVLKVALEDSPGSLGFVLWEPWMSSEHLNRWWWKRLSLELKHSPQTFEMTRRESGVNQRERWRDEQIYRRTSGFLPASRSRWVFLFVVNCVLFYNSEPPLRVWWILLKVFSSQINLMIGSLFSFLRLSDLSLTSTAPVNSNFLIILWIEETPEKAFLSSNNLLRLRSSIILMFSV